MYKIIAEQEAELKFKETDKVGRLLTAISRKSEEECDLNVLPADILREIIKYYILLSSEQIEWHHIEKSRIILYSTSLINYIDILRENYSSKRCVRIIEKIFTSELAQLDKALNIFHQNALHLACTQIHSSELIAILLQAEKRIRDSQNSRLLRGRDLEKRMPLHHIARAGNLAALAKIQEEGNLNINLMCQKNTYGSTPLHEAVETGQLEFVKVLLVIAGEKGAHQLKTLKNNKDQTAYDLAKSCEFEYLREELKKQTKLK